MPPPTPLPKAGKAAAVQDKWGHHPTPTPLTPPTSPAPLGRGARPAGEAGGYCPVPLAPVPLCTANQLPAAFPTLNPFQYHYSSCELSQA